MSPLLKMDSFYLHKPNLTEAEMNVILDILREHREWDCKIDLKFDKMVDRI